MLLYGEETDDVNARGGVVVDAADEVVAELCDTVTRPRVPEVKPFVAIAVEATSVDDVKARFVSND